MSYLTTFDAVFYILMACYVASMMGQWYFARLIRSSQTYTDNVFFLYHGFLFINGVGWLSGLFWAGFTSMKGTSTFLVFTIAVGIVVGLFNYYRFKKLVTEPFVEDDMAQAMIDYNGMVSK